MKIVSFPYDDAGEPGSISISLPFQDSTYHAQRPTCDLAVDRSLHDENARL